MIHVVAKNIIKEDKINEFLETTKELVAKTLKEEGCIEYILVRDTNNSNIFTFIEKWESQEHLDAHMKSEHFVTIVPKIGELTSGGSVDIYSDIK